MLRQYSMVWILAATWTTACGTGPATGGSSEAAATSTAASSAATSGGAASTAPNKLDMNAIFPAGPGRDLVLNNCQNCHTIVPIVVLQMEEDAWNRSGLDHRERVIGLPDDDFKTLYDYLKANFNPGRPVPKLPQELLDTWTGY